MDCSRVFTISMGAVQSTAVVRATVPAASGQSAPSSPAAEASRRQVS